MSVEDISGSGEFIPLVEVNPSMDLRSLRTMHSINQKYHRYASMAYHKAFEDMLSGKSMESFPGLNSLITSSSEAKILLLDNLKMMEALATDRVFLINQISLASEEEQLGAIELKGYPVPSVTPEIKAIMEKQMFDDSEEQTQLREMAIAHIQAQYLSQYEQRLTH